MEPLPLALLSAALVLGTYYFGKWVGQRIAFVTCALAYRNDKQATCKALEQLIEELGL